MMVLRCQHVTPIVSRQLTRPDDIGVTHVHSGQTDSRRPHHHCRLRDEATYFRLIEIGQAFVE
jgi:hypothetical protein